MDQPQSSNQQPMTTKPENRLRKLWRNCARRMWSVQSLILLSLLLLVVVTAAPIWATTSSLASKAVNSVAEKAEDYLEDEIYNLVDGTYVTGLKQVMYQVEQSFEWNDKLGGNITATGESLEENRKRMLSIWMPYVRNNIHLFGIQYVGIDNYYLALVTVNNRTLYATSVSNGDQIINSSLINPDTLEVIMQMISARSPIPISGTSIFNRTISRGKLTWLNPEPAFSSPPLYLLTVTVPFPDVRNPGVYLGVLYALVDVSDISSFLKSLRITENSRILLTTRSGTLIGTSIGETFIIINDTDGLGGIRAESLRALDHSDAGIRRTMEEMQNEYGSDLAQIRGKQEFEYGHGYRKHIVKTANIADEFGLDWILAINIANQDIMHDVHIANVVSGVVCAACVVLCLILALIMGCCIVRPLSRIRSEMNGIANMDFMDRRKALVPLQLFEIGEMIYSMDQMKQGLRNFEKYVPSTVVREVLRTNKQLTLGVVSKELTVLFLDIKGFTNITETTQPEILIDLLSEFFRSMSDVISLHNGVVDKYIGDAIMALFNAPVTIANHEKQAVRSSLEMNVALDQLNESWKLRGYPEVRVRIGINSSVCLIGHIGSESRINYTALGDGVNIAARCEALNKKYNTSIIIGQNTFDAVSDEFLCLWLGCVYLRGKTQAINVYEVKCARVNSTESLLTKYDLHMRAREAYENDKIPQLMEICDNLILLDPYDLAVHEWKERFGRSNP